MKKSIKPTPARSSISASPQGPKLTVIEGGLRAEDSAPEKTSAQRDALRMALVERARDRMQSGYYDRNEVVQRLVDVLWDELYTR